MDTNQHDLSDDELDHLFRDSAEKMDFDFEPESWTKMSQKLDEAMLPSSSQVQKSWQKRYVFLLIGLLFLIGGYYFIKSSERLSKELNDEPENKLNTLISRNEKINVGTNKVDTDNSEKKKNNVSENKASSENKNIIENSSHKQPKILVNEHKFSEQKTSLSISKNIAKDNVDKPKQLQSILPRNKNFKTTKSQIKVKLNQTKSTNNLDLTKNSISKSNVEFDNIKKEIEGDKVSINLDKNFENVSKNNAFSIKSNNASTIENENLGEQSVNNLKAFSSQSFPLLSSRGVFIRPNFNLPKVIFENKQVVKRMPMSPKTAFKKGLYLRLAISPDMSLVTMDELTKFGANWAALLEYRLNNHWSIQSGVIRSMKYYDSYPDSYQWPSNWPQPPVLIDINAACKMLDIPLNIRYDITQKANSRWFVGTGMTSYIMLNEKYVYNYENPSDPKIKWKTWQGKTGPYYFGVVNFSMGYEHQVFRKLSFQAEPFFKMPISKVGFGKVNLSTIGIFLSAKYPLK